MTSSNTKLRRLILAAMFLAIAMVLPLITGHIPQIGNMLCPMHIPVLLCGFFCGPLYGLAVGATAPVLRFFIFSAPPMPKGIGMCFELAAYGLIVGILYKALPGKKPFIYVALIAAQLSGRIILGAANSVIYGITGAEYGWQAFMLGAFANAIPGIILQLVLIPILVIALDKYTAR